MRDGWILDSHMEHQWLAPNKEHECIWPHILIHDERYVFVSDSICAVIERVLAHVLNSSSNDAAFYRTIVPSQKRMDIGLPVLVTHKQACIPKLIAKSCTFCDIDSNLSILAQYCSLFISIPVRTIRFDEPQHLLIGLSQTKVVWTAWTVEEHTVVVSRLATSTRTLKVELRCNAFAFDRNISMLAEVLRKRMQILLTRIFFFLPSDIAEFIADQVHSSRRSVTPSQFHSGASSGVLNYAMARLLRIAAHIHDGHNINVRKYAQCTEEDRMQSYACLRRAVRERNKLFHRVDTTKYTRSGATY